MFARGLASGLAIGAVASAAVVFDQLRKGNFGNEQFEYCDDRNTVYTTHVERGFFKDTLTVYKNFRTDKFMYDFEQPKPGFHWDMAQIYEYSSFKPIVAKVIPYPQSEELDNQLKAARVERSGTLQERKAAEMVDLLKIIGDFK